MADITQINQRSIGYAFGLADTNKNIYIKEEATLSQMNGLHKMQFLYKKDRWSESLV